jgi:hypothetical protein
VVFAPKLWDCPTWPVWELERDPCSGGLAEEHVRQCISPPAPPLSLLPCRGLYKLIGQRSVNSCVEELGNLRHTGSGRVRVSLFCPPLFQFWPSLLLLTAVL